MHGRWVHSGWVLPPVPDAADNYVMHAYVLTGGGRPSKERVEMVLTEQTEVLRPDELMNALDWPPNMEVGVCATCLLKRQLHGCSKKEPCDVKQCFHCHTHHAHPLDLALERAYMLTSAKKDENKVMAVRAMTQEDFSRSQAKMTTKAKTKLDQLIKRVAQRRDPMAALASKNGDGSYWASKVLEVRGNRKSYVKDAWTLPFIEVRQTQGGVGLVMGKDHVPCAAMQTMDDLPAAQSIRRWIDNVITKKIAGKTGTGLRWAKMFKEMLHGQMVHDDLRLQSFVTLETDVCTALRESVCALMRQTEFDAFTTEELVRFMFTCLIRSIPSGTCPAVEARAQRGHKDATPVITHQLGLVHSLFVTGYQERTVRVMNHETGLWNLLRMPPYTIALLHGRWGHSGWGVPDAEPECQHVFFAFVVVQPVDRDTLPSQEYEALVCDDLSEPLDVTSGQSLAWPALLRGRCQCCLKDSNIYVCRDALCSVVTCFDCRGKGHACTVKPAPNKKSFAKTRALQVGMLVFINCKGNHEVAGPAVLVSHNAPTWTVRHLDGSRTDHHCSELTVAARSYEYENVYVSLVGVPDEHRDLVWWALQVRLECDCHINGIRTVKARGGGDLFDELSPNFLALMLPAARAQMAAAVDGTVFVDIGAGTGLQLLLAAIMGWFGKCYGIEYNDVLVTAWERWADKLLTLNSSVWQPYLNKVVLQLESVAESQQLVSYLPGASVVLCWNTYFTEHDNACMFKLVAEHMSTLNAVLIVGNAPSTIAGALQRVDLPESARAPNPEVTYCMNSTRGRLTGNHLKDRWCSWFQIVDGSDTTHSRPFRQCKGCLP